MHRQKAIADALAYKIPSYKRIMTIDALKQALVMRRQPVLIGMRVYESMESSSVAQSGILPCPKRGEKVLGGHAVLAVGYKDAKPSFWRKICGLFYGIPTTGYLIVRNSWGEEWGQRGYFMIPYEYFKKYCYDFWIMES